MATGKIKWFNSEKKFGFIAGDDSQDYNVHLSNIKGGGIPKAGDRVTFNGKKGQKRLQAIDVVIDGPGQPALPSGGKSIPPQKFMPKKTEPVYKFVPRTGGKLEPAAHHEILHDDRYDVAFEIRWKTVTPTAINPALSDRRPPAGVPCSDERFKGYSRSWLRMNGFLAISPFTVKGAIANGVANLLGGCYRVVDPQNTGEVERKPLHSDAIPEGNQLCTSKDNLCPRCTLFGMVDKAGDDAGGFRGRFKAATLVSSVELKQESGIRDYSSFLKGANALRVEEWHDAQGNPVTALELLPVAMTSNPYGKHTREKYFHDDGEILGAKYFPHENLASARNIKGIDQKRVKHEHRTFGEVCRPGVVFSGTVGAENCSIDEIAALAIPLHSPASGHGFKLGIGKFFGLGSVESSVSRIWVRDCRSYTWQQILVNPKTASIGSFGQLCDAQLRGVSAAMRRIGRADRLNPLPGVHQTSPPVPTGESVGGGALAAAFAKAGAKDQDKNRRRG